MGYRLIDENLPIDFHNVRVERSEEITREYLEGFEAIKTTL
jgi:hypothetical protein